jgi:hypothetical protein
MQIKIKFLVEFLLEDAFVLLGVKTLTVGIVSNAPNFSISPPWQGESKGVFMQKSPLPISVIETTIMAEQPFKEVENDIIYAGESEVGAAFVQQWKGRNAHPNNFPFQPLEDQQREIRAQVKETDESSFYFSAGDELIGEITLIGGVDISFVKGDLDNACVALVVLKYPGLEVVYERFCKTAMTLPYIPSTNCCPFPSTCFN